MTRSEQGRMKILEMVAKHQISSEEGLSRIKALQHDPGGELGVLTNAAGSDSMDQATLYCQSYWETVLDFNPDPIKSVDCIVIFTDDTALAASLHNLTGARLILVKSGERYRNLGEDTIEINPGIPDDYLLLLRELEQQQLTPKKIIHGWSNAYFSPEAVALQRQLEHGIYSVYHLCRTLMEQKMKHPVQLLYAYSGEAHPRDLGSLPQPVYAAVSGFAKTICQENPQFAVKTIGMDASSDSLRTSESLAELLKREMAVDIVGTAEIRYENGLRQVKRYVDVTLDTEVNRLPFHAGGVYLITGGTGGLGSIFAKYLAQEVQAKLILVGRSEINDHGRHLLQELESLGAEAIYVQADIAKRADVEQLIAKAKAQFKNIHGVIHSAGILKDSFVLKKDRAEMDAVLAPKVYGTVYLDEFTQTEPLEFFAVFSSIAGVFGNVGQSDYAFANNFLDEFSGWRSAMRHPGKTVSVNWPFWQEGRMNADEASFRQMSETTGLVALSTEAGVKAFCAALNSALTQVVILTGAAGKIKNWIQKLNHDTTAHTNDVPVIALDEGAKVRFRQKTETFLKEILADQTKLPISKIDSQERFEKYGIDSGMILRLNRELERHFGELSKTLFFEYQNLHELANYFIENHSQQLLTKIGGNERQSEPPIPHAKPIDSVKNQERKRTRFLDERSRANQVETAQSRDIAIIGVSGRYPEARNIEEFWENLKMGRDSIVEIPPERWDYHRFYDPDKTKRGVSYSKWGGFIDGYDRFDPLFFNISPIEAEFMDPQERLFLETVWHTLEDAGYTRNGLQKNVGVFVGVMYSQYQLFGAEEMQKGNMIANTSSFSAIANRISYFFDFQGPSIAVDTMCSSSLTAIHLACESILRGECSQAIAGGVNLTIHPMKHLQLSQGKFAASDGRCRSFGVDGDGYVPGEGVGAILIKPFQQAVQDGDHIYAVIKGSSINHGGKTNGFTVPNPNAQANLISRAIKNAGVSPRSISCIEAHGTGTSLGDPIEIAGLIKSFRDYTQDKQYCSIGSAKSNIGHLESAAGIAGLTKIILQMKYQQLVPSIHSEQLNPNINFQESPFYVQHELTGWNRPVIREDGTDREYPRRAGISSFGAGGSNAHIILEEYLAPDAPAKLDTQPRVAVFSAKTPAALRKYLHVFHSWIEKICDPTRVDARGMIPFRDFIYTLQVGREDMDERVAVVAAGYSELKEKLTRYLETRGNQDGVYSGSLRDKTASNLLPIEGDEGKAFVHALIQKGEPEQLAKLWVSGVAIPWEVEYGNDMPRRGSLPSYPFEEERYWIPTIETPSTVGFSNLHPLIDTNESTLERQCYQKLMTPDEFYLQDHMISGGMILPGSAYLEMAVAAGNLAIQDRQVRRIQNVIWMSPIGISDESRQVRIHLYPEGGGVDFEIMTDSESRSGVVHSGGKLYFANPEEMMETSSIQPEKIQRRFSVVKDGAECYSEFQKIGFQYGPGFQTIQKLFINENECLAQLEVAGFLEADFSKYILHPSLLDGAFQTVAGFTQLAEAHLKMRFLPYALDELVIFGPLPLKCFAYVTVSDDSTPEMPKYNIELADVTGDILIRLKGFTLKAAATTALPHGNSTSQRTIYYQHDWIPMDLAIEPGNQPLGDTIIFDSGAAFASSLRERCELRNDSSHVILVKPGATDRDLEAGVYSMKMDDPQAYLKLLDHLLDQNSNLKNIIYRMPYESFTTRESSIKTRLTQGVFSLLQMTRALIQRNLNREIRLLYLYESPNQDIQPLDAALGAFMKTIRLEYPGLNYQIVEIRGDMESPGSNSNHMGWIAELVCRELQHSQNIPVEVRYDAQSRYIHQLQEHQPEVKVQLSTDIWREKGVYLITGGVGGLGFIFARHLAEQFKAKLVLVGRSQLTAETESKLRALEMSGAEVMYVAADVSKREDVIELVRTIKSKFSQINGIIHSAGVLRDSLALRKTNEEINEVLAAKIYGTIHLHESTREENLDFFTLFSSTSAIIGNIGQIDYAYANSFMDYFVDVRIRENAPGKTMAINWPLWENGGMRVDENAISLMRQAGLMPLSDAEGIRIFETGMAAGLSQLIVLAGEPEKINRFLNPEPAKPVVTQSQVQENSSAEQFRDEVETYIKVTLSKEIKLPVHKMDAQAPLEQYGIDSVMVLNLSGALESFFGSLSKTLFFEYKSVAELATYFIKYHPEKVAKLGKKPAQPIVKAQAPDPVGEMVSRSRFITTSFDEHNLKNQAIEDIAIIGVSGRYPMAADLHEFWENLKSGKDCITEIPRERWAYEDYFDSDKSVRGKSYSKWGGFINGVDLFDPLFFNISPREAAYIDPQERLFLETVWHTLEDAGYTRGELSKNKVGVFVGVMYGQYQLLDGGSSGISPGSSYASIANRVSYYCNFRGPSIALDTMCSSSLTAIHLACDSIRNGESEVAIAGGVNLSLHPNKYLQLSQGKFLASDGRCRSFGEGGDGYVPGEGVGAVLLKPLHRAIADEDQIYAVIKASSVNHGGKTNGYTVPNPTAQADLIAETLKKAQIDPRTVSYIEAHGTGTSLGDPIEITGLVNAFQGFTEGDAGREKRYCAIGSAKSNIGHLESAAGIAGITKVILQMKNKQLVPSLHSDHLNPHIEFEQTPFYVQHDLTPWENPLVMENGIAKRYPLRAGVSSFGAGGSNAYILLEEYTPPVRESYTGNQEFIFVFSAKNDERIKVYAKRMVEFLQNTARESKAIPRDNDLMKRVQHDLVKRVAEILRISESEVAATEFVEYGLDQFSLADLASQLNEMYHLEIGAALFFDYPTFAALSNYLLQTHLDNISNYYRDSDTGTSEDVWEPVSLADLAFTLQTARESMDERLAIVASSQEQLVDRLIAFSEGNTDIQDAYTGNVRDNRLNSQLLVSGREGREFLRIIIEERQLGKLAQLWISGIDIDWKQLYPGRFPARITLPGYPFAGERYWVSPVESTEAKPLVSRLHPLIDRNESTVAGLCFKKEFAAEEQLVSEYRIGDLQVVPGIIYLEMAWAAGSLANQPLQVKELTNVAWGPPIPLNETREVEIGFYPSGESMKWEIRTITNDGQKKISAQGDCSVTADSDSIPPEFISIGTLQADCQYRFQASEFYQLMERNGMKYGAGLQMIREFFANNGVALARFELPSQSKATLPEMGLHPVILEAIPQVIMALGANTGAVDSQKKALFKAARVKLVQPLSETGYVNIQVSNQLAEPKEKVFDAKVTSVDGRILAVIEQIQLADINIDRNQETAQSGKGTKTEYFLEKSWRASEITGSNIGKTLGTTIILGNEETKTLVGLLRSGNPGSYIFIEDTRNFEMKMKSNQEYGLNFNDPAQGARMIQEILKQKAEITTIIDISDLHSRPTGTGRLAMGKVSLLQELIKAINPKPLTIIHTTRGLHGFQVVQPSLDGAGMAGLVKMLGAEYQKVNSKTIDTDLSLDQAEEWAEIIQRELGYQDIEGEIGYWEGKRYLPYLKRIDPGMGRAGGLVVNPEQVIVITGGTRGIGVEIAKHLVRNGTRKLVLMGVQQLPSRSQWRMLAGSPDTDPGVAAKLKALLSLEDAGANFEIYTGSLIQRVELEEFFQGVRRRMGDIGGVVHCAGTLTQTNPAFIHKTARDIQQVVEPKMDGLEVLHELFKNDPLQFFILFSSVSGLIPALAAGVSDYATANAYLDYFSAYQKRQGYGYYKSINWPVWTGTGMASETAPFYYKLGFAPLLVSEGLALFDNVLQFTNRSQIMPCLAVADQFNPDGLLYMKQTLKARTVHESIPTPKSQPERGTTGTIHALKALFAEELKIPEDQLNETTNFADFGVDSILLAELVKKVEVRFRRNLEPGVFLEYPTLSSLGSYLDRQEHQETPPPTVSAAPQPVPEERKSYRITFRNGRELRTKENGGSRNHGIVSAVEPEGFKVAVIGIACHFPGANDKENYWANLVAGRSSIREVPISRWDIQRYYSSEYQSGKSISKWGGFIDDIEYFDPEFFNISEDEALQMDPLIRQFLEVSVETFQDAGYTREELSNKKVGIFAGSRVGYFASRIPKMLKNSVTGTGQNFIASYAAHFLNLKGPNMVVDTACSSSMVSIHLACQSLMLHESELALAGGVDILLDEKSYIVLSEGRALSPDGKCHTFDEKANGFVPGEGCGAVLLKRLDKAMADGDQIYAVIEASAINNDGRTMGITTPNPEAQSNVIQEALLKAGVNPASISYIENHGTGTMIGDPIELKALTKVFQESTMEKQFCAVGSVKTNLGHLLSAAGIASFIKVVLSLHHKQLPPTLNCETPNPRFEFESSPFYPNTRIQEWKPREGIRRAGISSFGFGGTNIHMIVSETPGQMEWRKIRQPLPRVKFNRRWLWFDPNPSLDDGAERRNTADPVPDSVAPLDVTVETSTPDAFLKFLGN
ncbi:SDR family NAD(P)-dependent oxidoreductase [Paenibacillus sp. chi10]|uniref:SDR family NAD(P)-dependent oxidoreductase n=1 Tax=Paenibacillus suaedae TaxID=3077233 RepID=A0AAJ2JX44_9BACL|nr:SDR family NAD(P)-dependent oxidoreductase [Paenibacillus sp. chi10]MDT8977374.1 SDR family NAD(P)-dependent oxidoreductase [Paenibacillus sp. chi10]